MLSQAMVLSGRRKRTFFLDQNSVSDHHLDHRGPQQKNLVLSNQAMLIGDVRQEKENLVRSASAGRSDTIEEETVEVEIRL